MFGLASWQIGWLLGLWLVWALLLFGGFARGGSAEPNRRIPAPNRMGSSLALVMAAWSWAVFAWGSVLQGYAILIAIGMTFGMLGDLWLAGWMPRGRSLPGGVGAFALGHVAYIVAMLGLGRDLGLDAAAVRWGALLAWLLIGAVGWYLVVARPTAEMKPIHFATLPYALLLAATTGFATGLALQDTRFVPLALGAALFLFSDLILAGDLFAGLDFPLLSDVVWLTYGPGQMLIVYAISAVVLF